MRNETNQCPKIRSLVLSVMYFWRDWSAMSCSYFCFSLTVCSDSCWGSFLRKNTISVSLGYDIFESHGFEYFRPTTTKAVTRVRFISISFWKDRHASQRTRLEIKLEVLYGKHVKFTKNEKINVIIVYRKYLKYCSDVYNIAQKLDNSFQIVKITGHAR